ncbi:MAG: HD domain-containing protein, partial [Oscillospiraceae bacterium]|nr:HD domain-containing protein [Oscillospiraceae bacterium]
MNIRESKEAKEKQHLDKRAALSCNAVRGQAEEQDIIRTAFQRDRDRIIHSTAFRRLKDKTQVFFMSHNDHVRTRLDHTLAVSQIARTIASSLNLNEDLTEAIALGHDLGHTPFGHDGEHTMNYLLQDGFSHEENGARIARELNLTEEVIDGILNHDSDRYAKTLEGQCVKLADKIAYVTHDFQDALRLGKAPADFKWSMFGLGDSYAKMIDTLVKDVISYSMDKDVIDMSPE